VNKRKYFVSAIAAFLLVSSGSITYAATKNPIIYYNSQKIESDKVPILKDGTTYVPLRMLSELFGKDVSFDSKTYNINIQDKPVSASSVTTSTSSSDDVQKQMQALQQQVDELKSYITVLTQSSAQSAPTSSVLSQTQTPVQAAPSLSLQDLQNLINSSDNRLIGSFQASDISLSGNSSNLTLEITGDLKLNENSDHWSNSVTSDTLNSYLQKIYNKIKTYYPNANISGDIRNSSYMGMADTADPTTTTNYLATFSTTNGVLSVNKLY
jgi:hypothetical protein